MKPTTLGRPIALTILVVLCALSLPRVSAAQQGSNGPDTLLTPIQWKAFEENLSEAVSTGNEGARTGALRQITRFGAYMDFDRETVFDVMRIYRDHKEEKVRRLAVLALGQMNDRWAVEFLDMSTRFEESPALKTTIDNVIAEYWKAHGGRPY